MWCESSFAPSACPLGQVGWGGARPGRQQGGWLPAAVPRGWIPAAGNAARMMLAGGQAIPACVCFRPGNCRLKSVCREHAPSQRHQVHGRVEPSLCAGPPPLDDELGSWTATCKAGDQTVLVPHRFGAAGTRSPDAAGQGASPSRLGLLPEETSAGLPPTLPLGVTPSQAGPNPELSIEPFHSFPATEPWSRRAAV